MVVINSAKGVEAINKPGYHRCGQGLYLQVSKQGTKSWVFRFLSPVNRKQREMGLGSVNFVTLAGARQLAISCKQTVIAGKDPIEERKRARLQDQIDQARNLTFEEVATACISSKSHEWKNAKHAQQWQNTLRAYAYPILGQLPVSEISTELIMRVLEPIWVSKAETASRLRQRIETVLDYAKARNYVEGENPARLKGHLDKLLPKTTKIKRVRHFPALPYSDIGKFIQDLRTRSGFSALGLEFLILTAARTGEVIGAKWNEIDLEKGIWVIPGNRMKTGSEHRVPLCARTIEILNFVNSNRDPSNFIFSGWKKNTGLSNGAFLALIKKMGRSDITAHGFRSCFRDWAAEEAYQFSNETVELALAHKIKSAAEAAYRRGDQLQRRRELMQSWNDYIETGS